MNEEIKQEYLGDAVYASFDGYHVMLAVNDPNNHVVALEPAVLKALWRYSEKMQAAIKADWEAREQS